MLGTDLPSTLHAKIVELFSRRLVIDAARQELDDVAFWAWFEHVTRVQRAIYAIDLYYERSNQIEHACEEPMWSAVEQVLARYPQVSSSTVWRDYDSLRSYASIERRLHESDRIGLHEFSSILTLKCSDVRIARALIWAYNRRIVNAPEAEFWREYDECSELIEDLEDLGEDGRDWNFNFWLYSFRSGQSPDRGISEVADLLQRRLVNLQLSAGRVGPAVPLARRALEQTLTAGDKALRNRHRVFAAIADGSVISYTDRRALPKLEAPSPSLGERVKSR